MSLKAYVKDIEQVDETVRGLYKELPDSGGFVVDIDPVEGYNLENVNGLKSALGKEKEERRKLADGLKAFEGLDPTKVRDVLGKYEELVKVNPEEKAAKIVEEQVRAAQHELVTKHERERKGFTEKVSKLMQHLEQEMITSKATKALIELKGSPDLLLPIMKSQARIRENEQGHFAVEILDSHGNPRVGTNGQNLTLEDLALEMQGDKRYARAFDWAGKSGGGAPGGRGGAPPQNLDDMSPQEKIEAGFRNRSSQGGL